LEREDGTSIEGSNRDVPVFPGHAIRAPGALHHIVVRGIERRKIFPDDSDRDDFLERLSAILGASRTVCYPWALMPNHYHLLLKTGQTSIATLTRRAEDGLRGVFQSEASAERAPVPEPLQVHPLPGGCLPAGTWALYPHLNPIDRYMPHLPKWDASLVPLEGSLRSISARAKPRF
jgi:hypothetical protein